MARIKEKNYELTDFEFGYAKDLNSALQLHIYREHFVKGFLTHIAKTRFGFEQIKEGYGLQFEIDLSGSDKSMKIKEVKI
jgi:hypothetical protein